MEEGATRRLGTEEDEAADAVGGGDRPLVCSVCAQPVTDERHAIEQGGAHAHVFVNPGGFDHQVRCFGFAEGVAEQGDPQTYFSWFPGYAWQIVDCAKCRVHIGWIFRCADDVFWGLIAGRLAAG